MTAGAAVFFDRSPVCTLALSRFLGFQLIDVPAGPLAERTALIQKISRELVQRQRL